MRTCALTGYGWPANSRLADNLWHMRARSLKSHPSEVDTNIRLIRNGGQWRDGLRRKESRLFTTRERGVTTGYRKADLVLLCGCVEKLHLERDPDFSTAQDGPSLFKSR